MNLRSLHAGERSFQAAHTCAYLSLIEGCVPKHQRAARRTFQAESGKWKRLDIVSGGGPPRVRVIHFRRKPTYQVHSCFALLNLQQTGKLSPGNFEQEGLSTAIKFAHPPKVAREVSLFDEVRQCSLRNGSRLQV